jgi:hypothetical protein
LRGEDAGTGKRATQPTQPREHATKIKTPGSEFNITNVMKLISKRIKKYVTRIKQYKELKILTSTKKKGTGKQTLLNN